MRDDARTLPIVDAHMHLWDLGRLYYSWLQDSPLPNNPAGDMSGIAGKNYLLDAYRADSAGWNLTQVVHVECGLPPKDQVAETDWLQGLADSDNWPGAIVAGATLDRDDVEALLEAQAARANVRGIRQIINWHADPAKTYNGANLLDSGAWRRGYGLLAKYGLSFDMQLYASQMKEAAALAATHDDIPVMVNHAGMPTDRDAEGLESWRTGMKALAALPHISCKISGLACVDRQWTQDSLIPFIHETIDIFGVERCMFSSNFPVERAHGSFNDFYAAYDVATADFSHDERKALFGENAKRLYRIA